MFNFAAQLKPPDLNESKDRQKSAMNLKNPNVSYTEEMIRKQIPDVETYVYEDNEGPNKRFDEYLIGKIGNQELWFAKMPSGRYVYSHSWASFSLRQLI